MAEYVIISFATDISSRSCSAGDTWSAVSWFVTAVVNSLSMQSCFCLLLLLHWYHGACCPWLYLPPPGLTWSVWCLWCGNYVGIHHDLVLCMWTTLESAQRFFFLCLKEILECRILYSIFQSVGPCNSQMFCLRFY